MPFKVVKRGDKYAVINADTGDVKGKHDTKAKAQAQLRAINANYKKGGKK